MLCFTSCMLLPLFFAALAMAFRFDRCTRKHCYVAFIAFSLTPMYSFDSNMLNVWMQFALLVHCFCVTKINVTWWNRECFASLLLWLLWPTRLVHWTIAHLRCRYRCLFYTHAFVMLVIYVFAIIRFHFYSPILVKSSA